ncbi:MAG: hypothetical protein NT169_28340 [Chloroflexi bacterium]|nr:hypothetical protein [Chloroflexota bacterium]
MRRAILFSAAIAGVAVACMFLVIAAQAAGPILTVDPADMPLRINGVLDGQTNSFSGNVRLTVTGGDADQVHFLASDLRHATKPESMIDRSSVTTVPALISLSDGQPSDVKVTIGNVKRAGDYTGTLHFLLPGQPLTEARTIPLELHVGVKPDIEPVVADQAFQVARCDWPLDCFLAKILLSGSATRDVWHVQLDNQASQPATVTSALAVMHSNRTAATVTSSQVMIGPIKELPANQVSTVPVSIKPDSLLPDRYQGKLRFTVAGLDEPVTINSTLDVRDGPFWALVVILLGIVVGRMARDMETPIAKKQVKLLPRWYDLRPKIDQITDQPARLRMESELQKARTKIDSAEDIEDVVSKFLDNLETESNILIELQNIEAKLETLPEDIQKQVPELIKDARSFLPDEPNKASDKLREITKLVQETEANRDAMMSMDDDGRATVHSMTRSPLRSAGPSLTQSQKALDAANQRQTDRWRRFLAGLSGLQFVTAETRFWFFRPALSVLLLVLLMLLGLQTLYVNSGATFGVGGLYDYLGLFLWGITADVAQRTLLNLPTARASA